MPPQYTPITGYGTKKDEWLFTEQGWEKTTQPTTSPVSYLSDTAGEDILQDKQETLARISQGLEAAKQQALQIQEGLKTVSAEPKEEKPAAPLGISAEDILSSGGSLTEYEKQSDGTYLPKEEYAGKTPETIALEKSQKEYETAKADYENAVSSLQNLDISKDPTFQGLVGSITSTWDVRIREMEQINKGAVAMEQTMGIRYGSRYLGSALAQGFITAREQEGLQRISDLEAKKQTAITEATMAYQKQEFEEYAYYVDLAEKEYDREYKELRELQKVAVEERKKITEARKKTRRESAIAEVIAQGITDPLMIYAYINYDEEGNMIGDIEDMISFEEIDKAVKLFVPKEEGLKPSTDYQTYVEMMQTGQLPEDMTFFDWKEQMGIAGRAPTKPPTPKPPTPDTIFTTPDGEEIDVSTVEGVKVLESKGYGYADIYAFLDKETKLTVGAIKSLLEEAGIKPTKQKVEQTSSDETLKVIANKFFDTVKKWYLKREDEYKNALLLIEKNKSKFKWNEADIERLKELLKEKMGI